MKTWLFIDCDYLCHRALHSTGGLQFNEQSTGTLYGFLSAILKLESDFATSNLVFCFDFHGKAKRREIFPEYKLKREQEKQALVGDERKHYLGFCNQRDMLRKEILPELGYRNVFYQKGYEADDMIAMACEALPADERAHIVSHDNDLYQLLEHKRVLQYLLPKQQFYTEVTLSHEYAIGPNEWPRVKAIAGDAGDEIPGVYGVGPKTAAKYVCGLRCRDKIEQDIKAAEDIIRRNLQLVTLPFPGAQPVTLETKEERSAKKWRQVATKFGMKSLL